MANAGLLKGGVIVVVLLAALAVFDYYGNYGNSKATGAVVVSSAEEGSVGLDLGNYPSMFVKDGNLDALIVVGDQASSANVIASEDIAIGLRLGSGVQVGPGMTKLASEVADAFAQNVISVGAGCSNWVTQRIQEKSGQLDTRFKCYNGALSGEGVGAITLYDFGNGKVGLVVEGYTDNDVRRAAKVLMSYKDWQAAGYLTGKGILVEATSQGGTKISGYGWAIATDQTASVCVDSDGGNFPDLPGEIHISGQGFGVSQPDMCLSSKAVREFYCETGQNKSEVKSCPQSEAYRCLTQYGYGFCGNVNQTEPYRSVFYPPADCSKGEKTYIREGETKRYGLFDGKVYEITADFVGSLSAVFSVNGETTRNLPELGERVLADGTILRTFTTVVDKQPYGMQFCLQKATDATAKVTNVTIQNGWNIIGYNTIYSRSSTTCSKEQFGESTYNFDPVIKDYKKININDLWDRTQVLEVVKAVWLYNKGERCHFTSGLDLPGYEITIPKGWNMLAVQPNWQGKMFSEIIGNCVLPDNLAEAGIAGFFYELPKGWEIISPDTAFQQEKVGKGFWIAVAQDCTFGTTSSSTPPPSPP